MAEEYIDRAKRVLADAEETTSREYHEKAREDRGQAARGSGDFIGDLLGL